MEQSLAIRKMKQVKTYLLINEPFFAAIALRLKWQVNEQMPHVFATDGIHLLFRPSGMDDYAKHLPGLAIHEMLHCAFLHFARGKQFMGDRKITPLLNIAMDLAINQLISSQYPLPENALRDYRFRGWSFEQIYKALEDEHGKDEGEEPAGMNAPEWGVVESPTTGGSGDGDGEEEGEGDGGGEQAEGRPMTEEELQQLSDQWKAVCSQAENIAKCAGSETSDGILKVLRANTTNEVPWEEILARFVSQVLPDDFSFSAPDRRFMDGEFILPSLHVQRPNIVLAVDTSGSVYGGLLERFQKSAQELLDIYPTDLTVIYCDCVVQQVEHYSQGDEISMELHGGGGTLFEPVFNWIEHEDMDPSCLVYLTDGEAYSWPKEPDYPVLWAIWGGGCPEVPFGEISRINEW